MDWIDANKLRPKQGDMVLAYARNSQVPSEKFKPIPVDVCHIRGHWASVSHPYPVIFTHWMPLPTPPQTEG
jgi:hypothetical protein